MTQKQIFGAVAGVAIVALAFVFVYQQFIGDDDGSVVPTVSNTPSSQKQAVTTDNKAAPPVPDTIDSIASSIESESAIDLSALDAEEAGSLDEINQDSDSVNNLGTSYDENNL